MKNISDVISVFNIDKDQYIYISPSIFQLRGFTEEEAMKEDRYASLTPELLVSEKEVSYRKRPE